MGDKEMTDSRNTQSVPAQYNDEINISDLMIILWRYRYLGLATISTTLFLAVAYVFFATPVYRTEAYLLPPLSRDIEILNIRVRTDEQKSQGFQVYTIDSVFAHFEKNLRSRDLRRDFFRRQNLHEYYGSKDSYERVFNQKFDAKLSITPPDTKATSIFTRVIFELDDPEKAAVWLNQFIQTVSDYTVNELAQNVIYSIQARIKFVQEEIASKRKLAKERREDLIVQLSEASRIAVKLGIKKPVDFNTLANNVSDASVSVNTGQLPLYARGSIALEAEIAELRTRESDDPYIKGLRNLQEELAFLEAVKIPQDALKVARFDQLAMPPEKRVSPKKTWVILGGIVLGVFLFLGIAFGAHMVSVFRREFSQKVVGGS